MKNSSIQFGNRNWKDWHDVLQPIPAPLQIVAGAFVQLQEERQDADYNNHEHWTLTDVQDLLNTATDEFAYWLDIRTHPMAGNYLLSMLLGRQR